MTHNSMQYVGYVREAKAEQAADAYSLIRTFTWKCALRNVNCSKEHTAKTQVRLCWCADWSELNAHVQSYNFSCYGYVLTKYSFYEVN